MNKDISYIITILFAILIIFAFYKIDKTNCEKQGGIYIWEWNSRGTKCHFKND